MPVTRWVRSKGFNLIHGHHLVYNTCWEDPHLDRQALELTPDDTVLMITSAGCNVLDYCLDSPDHIYAVDVNPRQNALLELKIAGLRTLDYEDFFDLFGRGRLSGFERIYTRTLRPALSPAARSYWDRHTHFFTGRSPQKTFYFRGSSGWFARLMNVYIDRVARIRDEVNSLLDAPTVEAQHEIYYTHHEAFWSRPLCWALERDALLSLVGVPHEQRLQIERHCPGGVIQYMRQCLEYVFAHLPLVNNYFWRVYLCGEYTPACCPSYLKPEHFQALGEDGLDRVTVHTTTIEQFLNTCDRPISRFILLDHMDWLSSFRLPALQREWQAIVDHAAPEARLIWRSGGMQVDYVDPLIVRVGQSQTRVGDLLNYHTDLAEELHAQDRVGTYGSFYITDLAVA